MKYSIIKQIWQRSFAILLFLGLSAPALAFNIQVNVANGTKGIPQKSVEEVRLISLAKGMEPFQSQKPTGSEVIFQDIPVQMAPFLVQVVYQGVNYNEQVPHGDATQTIRVPVTVYERTAGQNKVSTFKIAALHYFKNAIVVQENYYVENTGTTTFSEPGQTAGFYIKIPSGANIYQALASLGEVADEKNMLRVNPIPVEGKENLYLLNMPVLPGTKLYQVQYIIKGYNGSPMQVELESHYPLSEETHLILQNDLQVATVSNPGQPLAPKTNHVTALDVNLESIAFPAKNRKISLVVSGGTPQVVSEESSEQKSRPSGEILLLSPANIYLKIGGGLILAIGAILTLLYLQSNPAWLQMRRMQTKGRLEYELEQLQKLNLPADKKEKKINQLKARLARLEKFLDQ